MKAKVLGIVTTFECPIQCRHCIFDCGPSRQETMKLDDIKNIVCQASDAGIKSIAFTGGEPFLHFSSLEKGISFAKKHNIISSVATSSYWASDYEKAVTLLKKLKNVGLQRLSISTDDFHVAYVPLEFVRNSIQAALTSDIKVEIQCAIGANTTIDRSYLIRKLELEEMGSLLGTEIPLIETNVLRLGRATRYISKGELLFSSEKNLARPCPFVIRNPTITPDGNVSACCGFGAANPHGFDPLFLAGNLKEKPLNKILNTMENDLLFNCLGIEGPYSLLKILKNESDFMACIRYVSICDICHSLTHQHVKEALKGILPKKKIEIFLKKRILEMKRI